MTFAVFCAICAAPATEADPCPEHGKQHIRCLDDVDGGWETTESYSRDVPASECATWLVPAWALEEEGAS